MELDHFFVLVRDHGTVASSKARAQQLAQVLVEAGLTESFSRVHRGQGTANHRFQFDNVMVELLYIHDRTELSAPPTTALQLEARFNRTDASPFGICSRPVDPTVSDAAYPYALYKPAYLPPHLTIQFADEVPASEPLWFHLPFARKPEVTDEPTDLHPIGLRRLCGVSLETRQGLCARSESIANQLGIEIVRSERDHLNLHFEPPASTTRSACLSPDPELSLSLHW